MAASKVAGKETLKAVGKSAIGQGLKTFGRAIPGVGAVLGTGLAAMRALKGDFAGAALELTAGFSSMLPVLGTAASITASAGLIALDVSRANKKQQKANDKLKTETSESNKETKIINKETEKVQLSKEIETKATLVKETKEKEETITALKEKEKEDVKTIGNTPFKKLKELFISPLVVAKGGTGGRGGAGGQGGMVKTKPESSSLGATPASTTKTTKAKVKGLVITSTMEKLWAKEKGIKQRGRNGRKSMERKANMSLQKAMTNGEHEKIEEVLGTELYTQMTGNHKIEQLTTNNSINKNSLSPLSPASSPQLRTETMNGVHKQNAILKTEADKPAIIPVNNVTNNNYSGGGGGGTSVITKPTTRPNREFEKGY